jgi:pyruvate kinase
VEKQADIYNKNADEDDSTFSDSVIATACSLANHVNAKAIIGLTQSGYTAYRIASHRPKSNILIITPNRALLTRLSLVWGVKALYYDNFVSTDETIEGIKDMLVKEGYLKSGDVYVTTAGMPFTKNTGTNTLKLSVVE